MKKYEELQSKITDLIRSTTSNSDDFDEKYMKDKLKLDDDLPLNKMLEVQRMIIVFSVSLHESNKWYPHVFLDECLYPQVFLDECLYKS